MADSLLRRSVNSGITVLAISDIASHSFYRHQVHDMLESLGVSIDWIQDLPGALRPFVSTEFHSVVTSDTCDAVIAVFARYYLCRLQILAGHQWFIDIPCDVGFSSDDLRWVAAYLSDDLSQLFPNVWRELKREGPDDPESIHQLVFEGKLLAERYDLDSPELRHYLLPREELIGAIMAALKVKSPNIKAFIVAYLKTQLDLWWSEFRGDYRRTFQEWSFLLGAFVGGDGYRRGSFWPDLDEHVKRRDWLIRLRTGW